MAPIAVSLEDRTCIRCAEPVDPYALDHADAREYRISGVCPECFAELFPDDE